METLTVRNLDPEVKQGIKKLGAAHGRSMEAEARVILAEAVRCADQKVSKGGVASAIRERFVGIGGVELEFPSRNEMPREIDFNK